MIVNSKVFGSYIQEPRLDYDDHSGRIDFMSNPCLLIIDVQLGFSVL
jgi:hypothetical protein